MGLFEVGRQMSMMGRTYSWQVTSTISDSEGRIYVGSTEDFEYVPISSYSATASPKHTFWVPFVSRAVTGKEMEIVTQYTVDIIPQIDLLLNALSKLTIRSLLEGTPVSNVYNYYANLVYDIDSLATKPFYLGLNLKDLSASEKQALKEIVTNNNFTLVVV